MGPLHSMWVSCRAPSILANTCTVENLYTSHLTHFPSGLCDRQGSLCGSGWSIGWSIHRRIRGSWWVSCRAPSILANTCTVENLHNSHLTHFPSGWPSFRDQEVVWDNVRMLRDGETVSLTGTHLGTCAGDEDSWPAYLLVYWPLSFYVQVTTFQIVRATAIASTWFRLLVNQRCKESRV